jgi:hypothetical protein
MRLRGNTDGTTIENVIQIDFGGRVPALVTNLYVKAIRGESVKIQRRLPTDSPAPPRAGGLAALSRSPST